MSLISVDNQEVRDSHCNPGVSRRAKRQRVAPCYVSSDAGAEEVPVPLLFMLRHVVCCKVKRSCNALLDLLGHFQPGKKF